MAFISSNTRVAENRTRLVCLGVPPRHVYAACRRCLLTYSYFAYRPGDQAPDRCVGGR
jgi:hypothetical protein